jgi:hypothetical protein
MPPRPIVLAIVLFWTAMSSWLFYRDIWPSLRPGDPPPYVIDLADEARRQVLRLHWFIYRGDKKIGQAQTWVVYDETSDTFELHSDIPRIELAGIGPLRVEASRLEGMYRVTRDGDLREVKAELFLNVLGLGLLGREDAQAKVQLAGTVKNGTFSPQGSISWNGQEEALPLEPVPISGRGTVLNPLHPIGRIGGLRPGQHWRTPVVDPLSDSIRAMIRKNPALETFVSRDPGLRMLEAEVLTGTHKIRWHDEDVTCLVVEYRDQDLTAKIFVRESDGTVLRQVAGIWGEQLVLERD